MRLLGSIRERNLIPLLGSYIVAGFLALEAVDQLASHGLLPALFYPLTLTFYAVGIPATAVLAWYHGSKGSQKIPLTEIWLLSALGLVAIGTSALVVRNHIQSVRITELAANNELDPYRIAVLYFEDLSRDGHLDYLADGFTEALIAQLAHVRELHVISKNGVSHFRNADLSVDSIARALGSGTIVQGTVEDSEDRLKVSLRLTDGASGVDYERVGFELPLHEVIAARDSLAGEAFSQAPPG